MIKINYIFQKDKIKYSCDNCNKELPVILEYSFYNNKSKEYNKLILCEDCGNAMSNMFYKVIKNEESFKYENDNIEKI